MYNLTLNQRKRFTVKTKFKKYPLETILFGLWGIKNELSSAEKAYAATIAIEFSKPGAYGKTIAHIDKSTLLQLANLATSFCLNNNESSENFSNESNDIFYQLFNLIANQGSVSSQYLWDFSRALLLYKIIPDEIKNSNFEHSLPQEFVKDKGYSVDEYLQTCFLAFSAINGSGNLTDGYLEKAISTTHCPSFEKMNAIISEISASAIHYRRERKRLNNSGSFKYQPILMYPLIKPWSNIPKHSKCKRYLAPLPDLIGYKANIGIYHHFLSKYKTKFTSFFGKEIFERYVGNALKYCSHNNEIKNEDAIKNDYQIPNGVKIPDFLIFKNNTGVIVECKAAVLPLDVYTKGYMVDFKTTVNKIYKGIFQIANFEKHALNNSFYGVKKWLRIIITYEPLWGMNSTILSEILISDFIDNDDIPKFRDEFDKTQILSISQLDALQIHTSETNSLYSMLGEIKKSDFSKVQKNLIAKTGKSFKNSHLWKYNEDLINSLVPETVT